MKPFIFAILMAASMLTADAADVGVSITVGEPGFYGRIDIGDFPQPQVISPTAVIIRPVVGVVQAPVYLHVPPGHARNWAKHCHKYNACGERVLFVKEHWYNDVYVPQYHEKHGKQHGKESHPGKGKGKHKE